jgi:mannose-6-phosphate isomerase class I
MKYIKRISETPSFLQKGMNGYSLNLENKNLGMDIIDSYKGHEKYCTNRLSTHIYYILNGNGKFKIKNEIYDVQTGDIVEIPANTEFVYAGKMKMLLIMNPPFDVNNHIDGKENDLY